MVLAAVAILMVAITDQSSADILNRRGGFSTPRKNHSRPAHGIVTNRKKNNDFSHLNH